MFLYNPHPSPAHLSLALVILCVLTEAGGSMFLSILSHCQALMFIILHWMLMREIFFLSYACSLMDPALVYLHFALHCHAVKNDLAKSCREWRLWKSSALCSAICSALLATNTERGLCCLSVCVALLCFVVAQRDRETPCLHGGHVTLEKHSCSDTVEFHCKWVYIESSWHDMGLNEMSGGRKKEALGF